MMKLVFPKLGLKEKTNKQKIQKTFIQWRKVVLDKPRKYNGRYRKKALIIGACFWNGGSQIVAPGPVAAASPGSMEMSVLRPPSKPVESDTPGVEPSSLMSNKPEIQVIRPP